MTGGAAWRLTNTGARLFAASGRVIAVKLAVVKASGFSMTEAQLALFHALDCTERDQGGRLTTLAARANLSKANMLELIDRAVEAELVDRRPHPDDGRAKLVVLTAAGHDLVAALAAGLEAAEREVAAAIGTVAGVALKNRLGHYVASPTGLGRPLMPAGAGADWVAANVGRAFSRAAQRFVRDVATGVAVAGFNAGEGTLGLIRHLDLDGTRLTEVAARARLTKPAMADRVARAERAGYVTRRPDPADQRARTIGFTARGFALLDAARVAVASAEAQFDATVGPGAAREIRRDLCRVVTPAMLVAA